MSSSCTISTAYGEKRFYFQDLLQDLKIKSQKPVFQCERAVLHHRTDLRNFPGWGEVARNLLARKHVIPQMFTARASAPSPPPSCSSPVYFWSFACLRVFPCLLSVFFSFLRFCHFRPQVLPFLLPCPLLTEVPGILLGVVHKFLPSPSLAS